MVVNDNLFQMELLEVFLCTMGFANVLTVSTPDDAKQAYRNAVPKPSIVLIDHHLDMADGLRLLREMFKEDDGLRAVFLSIDAESERECYKAGAVEFVHKPFSIAEVGRAVNRAMRPGVVS